MSLKPEMSLMGGLAVAALVYAIHSNATPTLADMQGLPTGTKDVDQSERRATWMSAGTVAGISLLARDPGIFVIGSAMTIAMAWASRHALWTDSKTGPINAGPGQSAAASANELAQGPQMTTQDVQMFAADSQYT
ncbi:MAG TPA: hypothetical protein VGH54_15695 [Mycobacterium sp.]|jgi:hypothetical protein|uniref:hypothetical protein n=1 Tax=Mycobacterium sp. TaxID=1785 RepID=UPI002F41E7ED